MFESETLSYRELDSRSNQLAHHLRALGAGPETIVGLCVERSFDMVIALVGILKAGAAYLPLDPDYPQERLAFMLADAKAPILVTQSALRDRLPEHRARVVDLDTDRASIERQPDTPLPGRIDPATAAYVIYTSGSTGQPKGVAVTHAGIPNLAAFEADRFGMGPATRVLQFASLSFDAALWEISSTLAAGATLVLSREKLSGTSLATLIREQNVTQATLPPSLLADMPADLPLTTLIVAGEAISPELVPAWGDRRRLFNAYGPTETTVCATISDPLQRRSAAADRPADLEHAGVRAGLPACSRCRSVLRASCMWRAQAWRGAIWDAPG